VLFCGNYRRYAKVGVQYLTPKEAAHQMKVDRKTVYNWIKSGVLKGERRGKLWFVREAEVLRVRRGEANAK
jgi:excisionase family DNA binding protein